jgi:hypothetical protein
LWPFLDAALIAAWDSEIAMAASRARSSMLMPDEASAHAGTVVLGLMTEAGCDGLRVVVGGVGR